MLHYNKEAGAGIRLCDWCDDAFMCLVGGCGEIDGWEGDPLALELGGEPLLVECGDCERRACQRCAFTYKAPGDVDREGPDVDTRPGYVRCDGSDANPGRDV